MAENDAAACCSMGDGSPNQTNSVNVANEAVHLARDFSFLQVLAIGFNIMNVWGGLSFLFVLGFSAGGLPTIFYGFIGVWVCNMCQIAILAECASVFPTAGGSYHFAVFLSPPRHRKAIGYLVGWFNYLGMVFASCAINSVMAALVMGLVILWKPSYVMSGRWELFLLYETFAGLAWFLNLFVVKLVPRICTSGCYLSIAGFLAFTITLLAVSPKASARSVFVTVIDATGYDNKSLAIFLGLYTAISSLGGLDSACHLAEEIHRPAKVIPQILYLAMGSQLFLGIVWILVVGFSVTNITTIINTPTGIPILELVKLSCSRSNVAATCFWIAIFGTQFGCCMGAFLSASRQGFAFARDGGMFMQQRLTHISPKTKVPDNSIHLTFAINFVLGLVYLGSSQGFNALLGGTLGFAVLSYASPAAVMLWTGRSQLEKTSYSLGKFGYPCAICSVLYALLVMLLSMFPQEYPITSLNMNYAVVIIFGALILMTAAWIAGGNKVYHPPSFEAFVATAVPTSERLEFAAIGQDKTDFEHKIAVGQEINASPLI